MIIKIASCVYLCVYYNMLVLKESKYVGCEDLAGALDLERCVCIMYMLTSNSW